MICDQDTCINYKENVDLSHIHMLKNGPWNWKEASDTDSINPSHYKSHPSGIECIQITEHYNFCLGNAIKYLWRADHKGGIEDLKKARWYLNREIANREKADATN